MLKKKRLLLLSCLAIAQSVWAQRAITLDEAIKQMLEKQFSIKAAEKAEEIRKNNDSYKNLMLGPTLTLNGQLGGTVNNLRQEFANPNLLPVDRKGARNSSQQISMNANWTIFDGMGMFVARDQVGALKMQGRELTRIEVENQAALVYRSWYNYFLQKAKAEALKENLVVSVSRVNLARNKYEIGTGSKQEYLNSEVDYLADSGSLLRQENLIETALATLKNNIGEKPDEDLVPVSKGEENLPAQNPDYKGLSDRLMKMNPRLAAAKFDEELAYLNIKAQQASYYPTVNLTASYGITDQTFGAGLTKKTHSNAINYGVNFSMPVYNGFDNRRMKTNSELQWQQTQLGNKQVVNELNTQLYIAIENYKNLKQLLALEQRNVEIALKNQEFALDRYKNGVSTSLDLREAQRNAISAKTRFLENKFELKQVEVEILRLSGGIMSADS